MKNIKKKINITKKQADKLKKDLHQGTLKKHKLQVSDKE